VFVSRNPLFTIIMITNRKSSVTGNASKPKRSRDVLSGIKKVKILDIEIEKKYRIRMLQVVWQERMVE